jgi:hypothetical protein
MIKQSRLRAGLAATALAGCTTLGLAAAAPASASTVRGLNLNEACQQQYPNAFLEWEVYAALSWPGTAYSWQCYDGGPQDDMGGINMTKACQRQYSASSYAYLAYPYGPYAWRCA